MKCKGFPLRPREAKLTNITVINEDITQIEADAIIVAINSSGRWYGGVDGAIQRSSGNMFHLQAMKAMPLVDGSVIFAPKQRPHQGKFDAALFIVDDLEKPLYDLVTLALEKARHHELMSVSIPAIRTGAKAGKREPRKQALEELARAVDDFTSNHPAAFDTINLAVPSNEGDRMFFRSAFAITPA